MNSDLYADLFPKKKKEEYKSPLSKSLDNSILAANQGDVFLNEDGTFYIVAKLDKVTGGGLRLINLSSGNRYDDGSLFAGDEDQFKYIGYAGNVVKVVTK